MFETGLSDYHSLVITVMKSYLPRLKPKVIKYRSYKKFDTENFLSDLKLANFGAPDDPSCLLFWMPYQHKFAFFSI